MTFPRPASRPLRREHARHIGPAFIVVSILAGFAVMIWVAMILAHGIFAARHCDQPEVDVCEVQAVRSGS